MSMHASILLADDEEKVVRFLGQALREEGYEVVGTTCPLEARSLLRQRAFDVFVVDNVMPGVTGMELLRELRDGASGGLRPRVLFMTGHPTIDGAVEAMKLGAFDYLRKPFEVEQLLDATGRALRDRTGTAMPVAHVVDEAESRGIVGHSAAIRKVMEQARVVSASMSTVLLTGETGTGKELLARAIHQLSPRRNRPLVKVNCAAIPDNLMESELFGHTRGAFTGALTSKRGRFGLADGGSIFLDEIGTLSTALQPKILRVLQEREFEPLGSERTEHVDVRVIAATNRDLGSMVADGRFLQDLYYRLNVIPLRLPPLRERPEDIPALAAHFVRKHNGRGIDESAVQLLLRHSWPGNVRELENAIERAVVMATGRVIGAECIVISSLPSSGGPALPSMSLKGNVDWVERETVSRALEAVHGVKKDAAALVGVSQRAFSYYLSKHELE
jgi:DNA-binding NtrC family response regulator